MASSTTIPTSTTTVSKALVLVALSFRIAIFFVWPLILVVVLGLCALAGWAALEIGRFPLALVLVPLLALAICIYGAVLTLRTIPMAEIAISVPRDGFEPLWAFVAGVAESVGSNAPDNIIIGMTGNFYVTQVPIVLFDGTRLNRRTLYLSGPLLHLMDVEEVKAVLGHEFSHFTGNDTLYSSQVAPAYRSMREGMATMRASMEGNIFVAMAFLVPLAVLAVCHAGFRMIDARLSQRRELRCDEIASQVYGQDRMAGALVKVVGYGASLQEVGNHIATLMQDGYYFENYPEWFATNREHWDGPAAETVSDALTVSTGSLDSHPALTDRLVALGVIPETAMAVSSLTAFSAGYDTESLDRNATTTYTNFVSSQILEAQQGL